MASGQPVFVGNELKVDLEGIERYSDGADLREKVAAVLSDEIGRATMGRKAREVVLAKYSWDKIARDYVSGFEANIRR